MVIVSWGTGHDARRGYGNVAAVSNRDMCRVLYLCMTAAYLFPQAEDRYDEEATLCLYLLIPAARSIQSFWS